MVTHSLPLQQITLAKEANDTNDEQQKQVESLNIQYDLTVHSLSR